MEVIAISLPVILVVALGIFLTRIGLFTPPFIAVMNTFVYRVSLPALIVASLTSGPLRLGAALPAVGALTLATLASLPPAYLVGRTMHLSPALRATLMQAAFRGNLAFIGLPILANASGGDTSPLVATAVLVFAPLMLLYNVVSVSLFLLAGESRGPTRYWALLTAIRSNPLILAAVAGGLLAWLILPSLPSFATRTLDLLAAPAAPMALLSIGASIASASLYRRLPGAIAASILKVAAVPALAWAAARLLQLDQSGMQITMIFAACPTAAASYIVAKELGGDEALASNAIVLSTILSLVSMTAVLFLFFR